MSTPIDHQPSDATGLRSRRRAATFAAAVLVSSLVGTAASASESSGARDITTFACPLTEIDEHFTDIELNNHAFAIDCLATYGFAAGTAPGMYSPAATVTRGQMATFLYRLLEAADVEMDTSDQGFIDVAGTTHEDHINAIVSAHVASGTTDTTFSPEAPVTRAQMASLLVGAVVTTGAFMDIGPDAFDDDNGSVHESRIDALAHNGIAAGIGDRRFAPGTPVRRDAMASLLTRAVDFALENGGFTSPFSEHVRVAHLSPEQVATAEGGEADAEGWGEVWTIGRPDVLCFEMSTIDVGSGADHPERVAYLAAGPPGEVGRILVELPPPSAANAVPPGVDAWSGGCVHADASTVEAVVAAPVDLYLGLSTWEHEEALRGQLEVPANALATMPAAAGGTVDWNDRSSVDLELPSGWQIAPCEGDAPYLCMTGPDGTPDGTIMLLEHELSADEDTSRSAVEAEVAELHRVTEEDRRLTCGGGFSLEPNQLEDVVVGGLPGYRFGYTLRDPAGAATEHAVIHLTFDAGRRIIVSTAFSDPDACPGEDPERDELPITAIQEVEPHIDALVAQSLLPTDFDRGPLCRRGQVPTSGFDDTAGNAHLHHIDCLTWLGITSGYSAATYGPGRAVTRGQLAAVAARLIEATGEALPEPARRFTDLAGSPHAAQIEALAAAGVIRGTSATEFEPNRPATRSQATAVLVAAHELILRQPLYDEGVRFDDVDGVHASAISRAATAHLIFGTDTGSFRPATPLRRDQLASLVGRTANRLGSARPLSMPT